MGPGEESPADNRNATTKLQIRNRGSRHNRRNHGSVSTTEERGT